MVPRPRLSLITLGSKCWADLTGYHRVPDVPVPATPVANMAEQSEHQAAHAQIQAGVEANHAQATAKLFSTQAKPKVGRAGATHRHSPHIRSTGYCGYYSRNPRIISARKPQHGLITILSWQPGQEVTQFVGF